MTVEHTEPYDPGCSCATCAGYTQRVLEEQEQEQWAQRQMEEDQWEAMMEEEGLA